jgi:hypothetical protein
MKEAFMSTENDDTGEAVVAFVSGILVGFAATLLYVRIKDNRKICSETYYDDYYYDGGDLFV